MLNANNDIINEWLVSYLLGEADAHTRQRIEQWIAETPENQRYFDHFKIIWEASNAVQLPSSVNEHEAWQRLKKRTETAGNRPGIIGQFGKLKYAAAIVLAIGLSYLFWDRMSSTPVLLATTNEIKTDTLPDGSSVTLNKNSAISYAGKLKGAKRKIKLKGEAFFNVVADKNKPFVVEVNDITVTVLGTSFNIKETDGKTEVIVETGAVQVTRNKKSVILKEQEKLIVGGTDSSLNKSTSNDKLHNYYRTHEFVCDNTPLWKLVEVLNEAYQSNIVIENEQIRNLPLTTTFYNEPLDNILNIISETFNITVERTTNRIILK